MLHDLIVVAVTLALAHLELAVLAVFALRKVRKATRNPFAGLAFEPANPDKLVDIQRNPYTFGESQPTKPL